MTRAVMMIHGFLTGADSTGMTDFVDLPKLVEDRYDEVFLAEVPGHDTSSDYSAFTVDATLEYVEFHFARLKEQYDEVDLVGYSMGGALCTHLASIGGVKNLVLLAPANKYLNPSSVISGFMLYYRKIKDTLAVSTRETRGKNVSDAIEVYLKNSRYSADIAIKQLVPNSSRHTLLTFTRLIRRINENLKPWDARTAVFWGELDELVPFSSIELLANYFADAEHYVKIYDDVAHIMLKGGNGDKVHADVMKFLNAQEEFASMSEEKDQQMEEYKKKHASHLLIEGLGVHEK